MSWIKSPKADLTIGGCLSVMLGIGLAVLGLDRLNDNKFSQHHAHVFGTVLTKISTKAGSYGAHDFLCDVEFSLPDGDLCRETVFVRLDDQAVIGGSIELVPRETCADPVVFIHVSSAPYWCGSAFAAFCGAVMLWAALKRPAVSPRANCLQDT